MLHIGTLHIWKSKIRATTAFANTVHVIVLNEKIELIS